MNTQNRYFIKGRNASGKTLKMREMIGAKFIYERGQPIIPVETRVFEGIEDLREWKLDKHLVFEFGIGCVRMFLADGSRTAFSKLLRKQEYYSNHKEKIRGLQQEILSLTEKLDRIKEDFEGEKERYSTLIKKLKMLEDKKRDLLMQSRPYEKRTDELFEAGAVKEYSEALKEKDGVKADAIENEYPELIKEAYESLKICVDNSSKLFDLEKEIKNVSGTLELFDFWWEYDYKRKMEGIEYLVRHKKSLINRMEENIPKFIDYMEVIKKAGVELDVWIDNCSHETFVELLRLLSVLKIRRLFISHVSSESWFRNLEESSYMNFDSKKSEHPNLNIAQELYVEVPTLDREVKIEEWKECKNIHSRVSPQEEVGQMIEGGAMNDRTMSMDDISPPERCSTSSYDKRKRG